MGVCEGKKIMYLTVFWELGKKNLGGGFGFRD